MDNISPLSARSLPSLLRLSLAQAYTAGAPVPAPLHPTVTGSPALAPLPPKVVRSYAHPWPDDVERLGPRRVGPFAPCEGPCSRWSWVRYGDIVLCLPCVLAYNEPTAP